jgi:glycosyltransferase involved in cell wall biosynthesis
MYIVMFSINPLFPTAITGGAPKHLKSVAIYLGEMGHQVVILCSQVSDSRETFKWHENVTIHPILRFKQPFPQPYAIPAYDMALMIQDMSEYLAKADRFYMHDGEFLFPFVYQNVPTVVSLRDNIYPETLLGSFQFQSDKLILISEYSRRYFMDTVGRFFPELGGRIEVIHNGLDWEMFQPTAPKEILDVVPINPQRPIVLHPHRPEESKGIRHTLALVDQLVHRHGLTDVLALAPKWMESQLTPDLRDFYHEIEQFIVERGLSDNFYFHGWISQDLMPQYYSLGAVTVSLGSFPESFGNAVYESLGCGTPSVVARVTTHRELLPDSLIDKVDYGDIDHASQIVADIIRSGRRTSDETLAYLKTHYQVSDQRQRYADVILNAQVVQPMCYHPMTINRNTCYQLAYWCYRSSSKGVYHDFYGNYRDLSAFDGLFDAYPNGFTTDDAVRHGVDVSEIEELYRMGYLVIVA